MNLGKWRALLMLKKVTHIHFETSRIAYGDLFPLAWTDKCNISIMIVQHTRCVCVCI